jgi:hypothetical protein
MKLQAEACLCVVVSSRCTINRGHLADDSLIRAPSIDVTLRAEYSCYSGIPESSRSIFLKFLHLSRRNKVKSSALSMDL